ncbi:translation initiation factor IF-2 [Zavarzinia sp. CC-PAN008]
MRPAAPVEAPPAPPSQGPRPVAGQVLRPQPIPGARPAAPGQPQNQGQRRDAPGNRPGAPAGGRPGQPAPGASQQSRPGAPSGGNASRGRVVLRSLTEDEKAARLRALEGSKIADQKAREQAERDAQRRVIEEARLAEERAAAAKRQAEEDARRKAEEESKRKAEEEAKRRLESAPPQVPQRAAAEAEEDDRARRRPGNASGPARPGGPGRAPVRPAPAPSRGKGAPTRRDSGKISVVRAMDDNERTRSLSAWRRQRERERRSHHEEERTKVVRDVVVPESITVQELANRMAERAADVIKRLMTMGVMATINQSIDADTAELLVQEFGHRLRRVSESDVEVGLTGDDDLDEHLLPRAPVVTVMGHVDHGKTSLLDALRSTDVAAAEAGGITQHIGAYQVQLKGGQKISFLDTPGHEAFTAMRARGAKVTDIVVLVVAADDGVMPQTIEAIRHAKAADVPIIVAINKIDKPDANPNKVAQELLQYEIVLEELGGDTLSVPVSAKEKLNLDKLEETILLQAELLDLKANPDRAGAGVVIEAQLDRGRGPVATVLVQRGTLRVGDIFVAGSEWGRVRALIDDRGRSLKEAGPSVPVEVLGLGGTPGAGDEFQVVEDESRAREVTSFRQRRKSETRRTAGGRATLEQMFSKIREGQVKELPVVIKADVQGSAEAIVNTLDGLATDEVAVRILHYGVGGITESDINLAQASNAPIIAFNVRATKQARDAAEHEGVEIRYYSVIYNLLDDVKQALSGMLSPTRREVFLGNAEIRQVFDITKVGKVAGCYVTEGLVKRGAKVRLIRDNVVIHEGTLSTLKRFKDEVREVKQTFECGMAFEHYEDIRVGDIIEAFEVEEIARTL